MVIYRPHRGSLADSMAEAREFENEDEMKAFIEASVQGFYKKENIVIGKSIGIDERINWGENFYVCVTKAGEEDYIEKYDTPQCIGMCAYSYRD